MMRELRDDICLYHGSYCEVQLPDLKKCAKYKDFGQGFYLTTQKKQAEDFARISTRKAAASGNAASSQNYGIVSAFRFFLDSGLSIKGYPEADARWLHCVAGHRQKGCFPDMVQELKGFDVIFGKIANDKTNATITAYMAGAFGETGTEAADGICISLLLPERLHDQICFRTEKALKCLTFMESEKVWL